MKQKISLHPLIFTLYPLLFVLINTANQRHLETALRNGVLLALGGAVLYGVFWLVLRSPLRAALLASLCLLFFHAYDPVYELIRGRELLGFVFGKHRFLLPAWLGLLAVCTGWIIIKLKSTPAPYSARALTSERALDRVFNAGSLVMLLPAIALIVATGSWINPLRDAGLVAPPGLEVAYINVGDLGPDQPGVVGDAILLRSTEGKNVLIDGGYPNGLAAAYLREQGVTHLNMIVITHPHDDHTGGVIEILNTIPTDLVVSNGEPLPDSPVYLALQETIRSVGVKTQVVRAGDELPFGYLTFQVLSPDMISPNSVNHNSVILRLAVGKVAFLFTGDTDSVEQMSLLNVEENVQADIYKIPHHGAYGNTYPEFIAKVNPAVAIYMAGAGNMHGFPEAPTLRIFEAAGIVVYGTDMNGTIVVKTNGKEYEVIPEHEASQ